jgi:hypothetical protein
MAEKLQFLPTNAFELLQGSLAISDSFGTFVRPGH